MKDEHIQKIIDDVEKGKVESRENAKRIEGKLKDISDYLDNFFGPVSKERVKNFEEYIKEIKNK